MHQTETTTDERRTSVHTAQTWCKVRPHCVKKPAPISVHFREQVRQDLECNLALGIIVPVPPNTPHEWYAWMVVVPKHNGEPCCTVDL